MLLVEAHEMPCGLEWRYSTSCCTTYRIWFVRNDTVIAKHPHIDEWVRTEPFFSLRTPMAEYPFDIPYRGTGQSARWEYGVTGMTTGGLQVRLDDTPIWSQPYLVGRGRAFETWTWFFTDRVE